MYNYTTAVGYIHYMHTQLNETHAHYPVTSIKFFGRHDYNHSTKVGIKSYRGT